MYNSVFIEELEQHCHRFLWRGMENREPDVYVILRVNMGDKPAGAISAEALYKTAALFQEQYPRVAELLTKSTYVDDIVDSMPDLDGAITLALDTNQVLSKAGFHTKGWLFSGEDEPRMNPTIVPEVTNNLQMTKVLGVGWVSAADCIKYAPDIDSLDLTNLTRRKVLERTMKIYDPLGILGPFTLQAKVFLRETWTQKLEWDEVMSSELQRKWISFFNRLEELSDISYDRCLHPVDAVGKPILVIFSDGSDEAYGAAAYVRWELKDGTYWSRLAMAKSRIAPIKKISTPQMELNGAVVSKRIRQVIEKEMRLDFESVIHLIDTITVLEMLHKISTRFKIYEGVRLGEIQAATQGNMDSWSWIEGKSNIADYLTRPKNLDEISQHTQWWKGPAFLETPVDSWDMKSTVDHSGVLPGEKASTHTTDSASLEKFQLIDYSKFSNARKLVWTIARVLNICKKRSFKAGSLSHISAPEIREAKFWIAKDVQYNLSDMKQYKQLKPVLNDRGVWVIGARIAGYNPLAEHPQDEAQILLPTKHPYTRLLIRQAHVLSGHSGRDTTLARFRWTHWTPQASKLAAFEKRNCTWCRRRDMKLIKQQMGTLPTDRLSPAPPFNHVMLDIFGPYMVKGEVQKRVSGKAYGVIFTDLHSRAVHIEPVFGYDTASIILALVRFTSIRGWPEKIYSDPGSQLTAADKELSRAWDSLDVKEIHQTTAQHGSQWIFSPADSPWRQRPVEALIKSAKRCFHFSMADHRLSPTEFTTVCYRVANILNERPLGTGKGDDSCVSVLTPNLLLLGRTGADNPGNLYQTDSYRQSLVSDIYDSFWKKWVESYAPTVIRQCKWFDSSTNLKPGDIVVVCDQNMLKNNSYLAIVREAFPSKDGKFRKVALAYKNFRIGEKVHQYNGATDTIIYRSVQKLALLVPASGDVSRH